MLGVRTDVWMPWLQVNPLTNYTQLLNASALKGVRIGVFRQIRWGDRLPLHWACRAA